MAILQNLVEGLAEAAGNTSAVNRIEGEKSDRRATAHEELQANTKSILNDVAMLQDRRSKLDPNSPTFQKDVSEIDAELHKARQAFTDLYHPAKNPGALGKLGGFLKEHLGGQRQAQAPPSTPGEARQRFDMAGLDAAAAGTSPAQANPILVKRKQMQDAGFTPDQIKRVEEIDAGLQAKPTAPKQKTVTSIEPDPESATGYSKVITDQSNGEEVSRQLNVLPPRGFIGSESTTVDPFGVSSTTTRKPVVPGTGKPAAKPSSSAPTTAGEMKKKASAVAPGAGKQLDADGHIPSTAKVNPNLREAANQLIDGMDLSKSPLPKRDQEAAAALARSYGWAGQGLFGPKDKLLLRESTGILKQLTDSPALSVLDDTTSRLKLQQVLQNPEKRGVFGQTIQTVTAENLTPAEQQFVTLYNQAVGRISGLSQLVRSGRATEAQIERLKQELPNPATTSSSGHARQKLAQIQNEIDIALDKGQFVEGASGSKHRIKVGDKTYEYKGSGATEDMNSYTEVK